MILHPVWESDSGILLAETLPALMGIRQGPETELPVYEGPDEAPVLPVSLPIPLFRQPLEVLMARLASESDCDRVLTFVSPVPQGRFRPGPRFWVRTNNPDWQMGRLPLRDLANQDRLIGPVYHRTEDPFLVADTSREGLHFGSRTQALSRRPSTRAREIEAKIQIQRPLVVEDLGTWTLPLVVRECRNRKALTVDQVDQIYEAANWGDDIGFSTLKAMLEAQGYDGFEYENLVEGSGPSWVVFHADQIRPTADLILSAEEPRFA